MKGFENVPVISKEQYLASCERAWNDTVSHGEDVVGALMFINCKGPIFQMSDGTFTGEDYLRMITALEKRMKDHIGRVEKVYKDKPFPSSN